MKRLRIFAAAATFALGSSVFAAPVEVDFSSNQSLHGHGSFTGTAAYDSTAGTLTLDITNTSKGALTAFAFEVEKGDAAKFVRPSHSPWKDERGHKGLVKAKPFGTYEAGAGVNGKWGSTATRKGLGAGQTGAFVFHVTGNNASSLTTGDFFTGTQPEIVATFSGFKKSHFKNDRASGFGSVVTPTITTTTTTTTTTNGPTGGNSNPILDIQPPPITGAPIIKPISGPTGGSPSAIPLPAAAPAGLAMLALFGLVRTVRRFRSMIA